MLAVTKHLAQVTQSTLADSSSDFLLAVCKERLQTLKWLRDTAHRLKVGAKAWRSHPRGHAGRRRSAAGSAFSETDLVWSSKSTSWS